MLRRAMHRARYRKNSSLIWFLVLVAVALIIVRLALTQPNPVGDYFKRRETDALLQFELHGGAKPTLCAPVKDEEIQPVKPGVKYGQPIRDKKHVMYTSVPKCGSRSLIWVMWEILGRFNSTDIQDFEYRLDESSTEKEKAFLSNLQSQARRPTFFHAHHRFLDYEQDDGPVFISILREPVSRFVSWYYFMRHGDADMNNTQELQSMLGKNAALPNETIDDCFKNKRTDCTMDYYFTLNVMIFCGYHKKCSQDREFALAEAKKNLDKYMLVGIMEEYEDTVRLLEKLMPSVFGGGAAIYKKIRAESESISKTKFKAAPSPETLTLMKSKMKEDTEFYEYAKQRFHDLKLSLKIGTTRNC